MEHCSHAGKRMKAASVCSEFPNAPPEIQRVTYTALLPLADELISVVGEENASDIADAACGGACGSQHPVG